MQPWPYLSFTLRDGSNDSSTSETPISVPQHCDLALSDSLLWFSEGYPEDSAVNPISPLTINQNPQKQADKGTS